MKRESTFNFRLPTPLKKRLDHFCAQRGMSKADVAVAAIREFLDQLEKLDRHHLMHRVYPLHDGIEVISARAAETPEESQRQQGKA